MQDSLASQFGVVDEKSVREMNCLLEAAVDSVEAAVLAEQAGADRLELCAALELGGLTPGMGLMQAVRKAVQIPVFVLIRPRAGGFLFTQSEHETMLEEIQSARLAGMDGVVMGALDDGGKLDLEWMRRYLDASKGLHFTCHRAFDRVTDQFEALEQLVGIGVERVLSSGGQPTAWEGRERLKEGRIVVLAGAGISPENALGLATNAALRELHFSAIKRVKVHGEGKVAMGPLDKDTWNMVPAPEKVGGVRRALLGLGR